MDSRATPLASRGAGAACIALIGALLACGDDARPTNLLWIVSDTLRADSLHCYGGRAHAPNICGLADSGVLFESAYSTASWTLPSAATLFTGNSPRVYAHADASGNVTGDVYHVNDDEVLLAEELGERGYAVHAFVENPMALRANAMQGFDFSHWPEVTEQAETRAAIEEQIGTHFNDIRYQNTINLLHLILHREPEPFFALLWTLDPHAVYRPPEHIRVPRVPKASELRHPPIYYARLGTPGNQDEDVLDLNEVGPELNDTERQVVRMLYDLEVQSIDERVGMVLRALQLRDALEHTLIVFTADHGEAFDEHGAFMHRHHLYDELVRVPLVIQGPGVAPGRRVVEPVSHLDLEPTLRELMGVEPREGVDGRSFAFLLRGERGDATPSRPEMHDHLPDGPWEAIVDAAHKLILRPDGRRELYDLRRDPGEQTDLAAGHPDIVDRLSAHLATRRAALETRRSANAARIPAERLRALREETAEQLRALGYAAPESLPDGPRDIPSVGPVD